MHPQFKKFKLSGYVYLWKYRDNTRNYPGWNITFDQPASDSLLELLDLMAVSKFSSEVVLQVDKPKSEHLQIVNRGSRIKTVDRVILKHKKTFEKGWNIQHLEHDLQITFDPSYLEQLKDSVFKVKRNDGDFAICDSQYSDDSILYFWWHPRV